MGSEDQAGLASDRGPRRAFAPALAIAAALSSGCAAHAPYGDGTSHSERAWIDRGETIALLRSPQFLFDWTNDERATRIDPLECIRRGLVAEGVGDRIVSEALFTRTAFPDLPPEGAPTDPESIRLLLTHPELRRRIEPLNIRYLVYATSVTEIRNEAGGIGGVVGYTGGAIVAWERWDQSSEFSFIIIDAKALEEIASARTRHDGSGWQSYGMVVVPYAIGYEAPTESTACEEIARKIREAFEDRVAR